MAATGVAWIVAQTADLPPFVQTALENSAWAALVFFFVWCSWKREEMLGARISKLEEEIPSMLKKSFDVLDRNADALKQMTDTVASLQAQKCECHYPRGNG